jgi:hypothetical protein
MDHAIGRMFQRQQKLTTDGVRRPEFMDSSSGAAPASWNAGIKFALSQYAALGLSPASSERFDQRGGAGRRQSHSGADGTITRLHHREFNQG